MSTRAMEFLKKKGIPFEVLEYDHKKKGAAFASEATGFPLEKTIKTLVVDLGAGGNALVLMPGDRKLHLKRLARVFSVKRAAMADADTAERLTGYLVGGISPFGTTRRLPVVMEEGLTGLDRVAINGGRRGVLLLMDPGDISNAVECQISQVASPRARCVHPHD
jgi:Cys-tRNA(Pro)/Cys-tRNA(Cys) deacylase